VCSPVCCASFINTSIGFVATRFAIRLVSP
jgi:hypothetical protein